jgi:hypothetical protein
MSFFQLQHINHIIIDATKVEGVDLDAQVNKWRNNYSKNWIFHLPWRTVY